MTTKKGTSRSLRHKTHLRHILQRRSSRSKSSDSINNRTIIVHQHMNFLLSCKLWQYSSTNEQTCQGNILEEILHFLTSKYSQLSKKFGIIYQISSRSVTITVKNPKYSMVYAHIPQVFPQAVSKKILSIVEENPYLWSNP